MKDKLIPQLRFPEFEGEWKENRISTLGKVITGNTPSTSDKSLYDGEYMFVSPFDLKDNKYVYTTSKTLTVQGFEKTRKISRGSVLFVCIGSTIGKVAIAGDKLATNQQINSINPVNVNNEFLYYQLLRIAKRIKILAGEQAVPIINKTQFEKISVNTTSPPEQNKIANFLTAVDRRIEILQKKREEMELYKKGVMQKLFDGHFVDDEKESSLTKTTKSKKLRFIPPTLRFKDDNGNDFPDWEEKRLGEVLKIGNGRDYRHLDCGNIPVFGTGGYMTSVNSYLYDGESVCIGRKGTIDKPIYLKGKFWTVDTLFYTYDFNRILPIFVFILFQQVNWRHYNEASGVPSLSKTTIERIKVSVPQLDEQKKIADFLNSIDKEIEKLSNEIEESQQFKKGLLQRMFV